MRSTIKYPQTRSSAPRDLADINRRLMVGRISPEVAKERLWRRENSWEGARGPISFFGPVSTSEIFVVHGESKITKHGREAVTLKAKGYLGRLELIGIDLQIDLDGKFHEYKGDAIAAQFSFSIEPPSLETGEDRFVLMSLSALVDDPSLKQAQFEVGA